MIAALSGKLIEKAANRVVIDVGGVGYDVAVPLSTYYELGDLGSDVSLHIYTYVREDTLQLYGFGSAAERTLFLRLISVSGIGPKLAVTILSGMGAEDLIGAVRTDNLALLTSIPGVGKKTAERLVIELRDKLDDLFGAVAADGSASTREGGANETYEDALSALTNLGYQHKAANKALKKAIEEGTEMSVRKLLRKSLQLLGKK